jgi:MYXO-CTERM domain-containing protein
VGLTDTGRRSWLFVLLGLFLIGALRIACLLPKTFNADSS